MSQQPKALELAEFLECFRSFPKDAEAAALLRTQHAELEDLRAEVERLKQVNHNQRLDICGLLVEVELLRAEVAEK